VRTETATVQKKPLTADQKAAVNWRKTVAIVVPLSYRQELTAEEKISLKQLNHFLGRYDKYALAPKGVNFNLPGLELKPFPRKFFGSPQANDRLGLSRYFYEAFSDYRYMLIYHLDALVFSDQLLDWCGTDLDYIGPPWIPCSDSPWVKTPAVGNGGFNLRKIDGHLKVLKSSVRSVDPGEYWKSVYGNKPKQVQYLNLPKKYLKYLPCFNKASWEARRWSRPDEYFWVRRGMHYYPDYRVASVEQALRFGFEVAPKLCYELNGFKLPFGCHAWARYDREFWEPYLVR
jgi:hypothetical protein